MNFKINLICVMGLVLVTGYACARELPSFEKGNIEAAHRVLIAGTSSKFKEQIVNAVINKLGTTDYYFKVVGLSELKQAQPETYGAILLVSVMMAGHIDDQITSFMKNNPAAAKTIVYFTRGAESPLPDNIKARLPVDAVSSASKTNRVESVANELAELIAAKF